MPLLNPSHFFNESYSLKQDSVVMKILVTDDPYEILAVSIEASKADIIASYKALVLKYHPDKHANDPEDYLLATRVTGKLNAAKIQALSEERQVNTLQHWQDIQLTDHEPFLKHLRLLILKGAFSLSFDNFDLKNSSNHYCLAMVLNWMQQVLDNNSKPFYQQLKLAFKETVSTTDLTDFAKQTQPYILKNIKKTISANSLGELMSHTSQAQDSMIVCNRNIRWNLDLEALSNILDEWIMNSPNTPQLLHNAFEKEPRFVGIIYTDNNFYLFSPYCLLLNRSGDDLLPLNKEMLLGYLIRHFYGKQNALSNETKLIEAPIGLCSFEKQPIPNLEDKADLNQIVLQAANDSIAAQHQDFLSFVSRYYLPESIRAARSVLQSVRDGHVQIVLANVYKQAQSYFTRELLCEFLDEAIAKDHLTLALEICGIDLEDNELTQQLCGYYINHYFTRASSYQTLAVNLAEFKKINLDLKAFLNKDLLHPETKLGGNLISLLQDKQNLACFFDLGFSLNEDKLDCIVRHLSRKVNHLAKEYNAAKLFREDIDQPEVKQHFAGASLFEKFGRAMNRVELKRLPVKLQKPIELLEMLIAQGYPLFIKEGQSINENPFMGLFKAGLGDRLRQWCHAGSINFNARDNKGKTILNYMSATRQWDMVAFLYLELKAEFSTGDNFSYMEIPPLAAWFEQVDSLASIFPTQVPDIQWLLSLVIKETDVLALAISRNRMDIAGFLLEKGFLERLKSNPTLYLYQCNFEAAVFILQQLSLPELRDNTDLSRDIGYDFKNAIQIKKLLMQGRSDHFTPLQGLSEQEVDAAVVKLPFAQLNKITIEGHNSVYYSANDELTDCLPFFFYPELIKQEMKSIKQALLNPGINRLPDVSFYMNRLFSLSKELYAVANWADKKRKDLAMEDIDVDENIYINSFHCFQDEQMPIALKVTYDDENRVCDFRFIPSLDGALEFSELLFEEDLPLINLCHKVGKLDEIELHYLLVEFYRLKLILDEVLTIPGGDLELQQYNTVAIKRLVGYKTGLDSSFDKRRDEIRALIESDHLRP